MSPVKGYWTKTAQQCEEIFSFSSSNRVPRKHPPCVTKPTLKESTSQIRTPGMCPSCGRTSKSPEMVMDDSDLTRFEVISASCLWTLHNTRVPLNATLLDSLPE